MAKTQPDKPRSTSRELLRLLRRRDKFHWRRKAAIDTIHALDALIAQLDAAINAKTGRFSDD